MENTITNLEEDRFIVSIGCKGSGKTTLLLNFIKKNYVKYDMIFLFLPAFSNESTGKYNFLEQYPNVFIQTGELTATFIDFVYNTCQSGNHRIFLGIDDATGYGEILSQNQTLKQMITTTRHIKCTIWVCIHASKKILAPAFRSNIDYLFIHNISNSKLLNDIYDEFFSRKVNKNDFFGMIDRKGIWTLTGINLINKNEDIDFNVADWKIMTEDLPEPKKISPERLRALPQQIKKYIPHEIEAKPQNTNTAQKQTKETKAINQNKPKSSFLKMPKFF